MVKLGDFGTVKLISKQYANHETKLFYDTIDLLKAFQTKDYRQRLNVWFDGSQAKLQDCVSSVIAKYKGTDYLPLVVFELGKMVESREKKVDAVKYYEAVKNLVNNKTIRNQCDIRWIVCKERQGRITSNTQYMDEAKSKRREKNIDMEMTLPEFPSLNNEQWESLFEKSINIDLEEVKASAPKPSTPIEKKPESTPTKIVSKAKQELSYKDYTLRYFPQKREIRIERNTDEYDYSLSIKKGELSNDSGFYEKNGRLYLSDIDEATPFGIRKDEIYLWIEIFDGDNKTGLSITTLIN